MANQLMYPEIECRVCGLASLDEIEDFQALPRVTSDCKPLGPGGRLAVCSACGAVQKVADERWQGEASSIYAEYDIYYQAGGVEQSVFDTDSGAPRLRSAVVLDRLIASQALPEVGNVLDVGCGNGALLRAFSEIRPNWHLYGHDLNDLKLVELERMSGFKSLVTGTLGELKDEFNLVTLIHSLEHFTEPVGALIDVGAKLLQDGSLLIEVPDAEANPFDLVVADHLMHFSRQSLENLLVRAGYNPLVIANDWVVKELSAIALPTTNTAVRGIGNLPGSHRDTARHMVQNQVRWLQAVLDKAQVAAATVKKFGIFGSSIAAVWLFGHMRDKINFFVDEDPGRENAKLFDRPIYTPRDAPPDGIVFVPLIPKVAHSVAARWPPCGLNFQLALDI